MNKGIILMVFVLGCIRLVGQEVTNQKQIASVLNAWHQAASAADFETYFGHMTHDGVFIGTDAMENWQNIEFKAYAKPYFDRGRAWSFTVLERNTYLNKAGDFAWFDELLDTQMKLCRGSGVMKKIDGAWKIAHYVLSITVPNEKVLELIDLKREKDSLLTIRLKKNR